MDDSLKWIGEERRIQPPISREEHDAICNAFERKLNERFGLIHDRFVESTDRMKRIEHSIAGIEVALTSNTVSTDERIDSIEASVQANTSITQEIKQILDTARGAFKLFGILGDIIKWTLGIGAAVLGFWVALKDFRVH